MSAALLIIIYISFISLGLPDSLLGSAWPSMYGSLGVPLSYAGYVSMIIAGGTVASSVLSAGIIRRFGTGAMTAVSVLMTSAALIGYSLAGSFAALCLLSVPLGLGAGSVDAALNNYVALRYEAKHMSWLHCFWGVGASAGPAVMSLCLMKNNSWGMGYLSIGAVQLCVAALLFASLPMWAGSAPGKPGEPSGSAGGARYPVLLALPGVKHALATFFLYCSVEATAGLWGSSYLVAVRRMSPESAARVTALFYFGITAGRFASGFLTMRLGSRRLVRAGQALAACGAAVLLSPLGNSLAAACFFVMGLGCAPIFPSLLHETPENFGAVFSQPIMGLQMASAYIGTTFTPPLFGRAAASIGFESLPLCVLLALAAMAVVAEVMNRRADAGKNVT
jgi:fucose permease